MADIDTSVPQGVTEVEPVQTAEVLNSETTETTESTGQAAEGEETTTEPVAEEAPKPKVKTWAEKRLGELTYKAKEAERQRDQVIKERDAALALVDAANRGEPVEGHPRAGLTQADVDRLAEQKVQQQSYKRAVESTIKAGAAEFPDFNDNCSVLADLGANERPEFMQAVTDPDICEHGHKVLQYLGQNPEEADSLLKMPAAKMAAKLALLSDKVAKPKPVPVSAAPAPIKPIDGRGRADGDPEKMSDADFDKFYGAKLQNLRSR